MESLHLYISWVLAPAAQKEEYMAGVFHPLEAFSLSTSSPCLHKFALNELQTEKK
jgi:hypothetical protein